MLGTQAGSQQIPSDVFLNRITRGNRPLPRRGVRARPASLAFPLQLDLRHIWPLCALARR